MNSEFAMTALWRMAAGLALSFGALAVAQAAQVRVAVAANFSAPMHEIAAAFERDSGHKAVLAFGATGAFAAQIRNGAPFDLLLAADQRTPEQLVAEGNAVPTSRFTYAIGRLVLWSAQPGVVDARGEVLKQPQRFARLAVANPKLAPYGQAAMETMDKLGVLEALRPKLVQGESIAKTLHFVASGNAQLGFVALAQVQADGKLSSGSAWIVPAELHTPIRQDAVLLQRGRDNVAATALLSYLRSEPARRIIAAYGYGHER